jgi:hypothetical protein
MSTDIIDLTSNNEPVTPVFLPDSPTNTPFKKHIEILVSGLSTVTAWKWNSRTDLEVIYKGTHLVLYFYLGFRGETVRFYGDQDVASELAECLSKLMSCKLPISMHPEAIMSHKLPQCDDTGAVVLIAWPKEDECMILKPVFEWPHHQFIYVLQSRLTV